MTACVPSCTSNTSNVLGLMYIYDIRIEASDCLVPTGEITNSIGWSSGGIHAWRQLLTPSTTNFVGRRVQEENPGNGGPDTCWFLGSDFGQSVSITGGPPGGWPVGSANQWGDDFVGWEADAVTYYRDAGRAPCLTSFSQRMVINCGTGSRTYTTNMLMMGFDYLEVWSMRAGAYAERVWP